jgi:antitoxin ParD1/3/4
MATMNISLPDKMKQWVEEQAGTGRYSNASDVVRDLIRKQQLHEEAVATLNKIAEDALASGISTRTPEQLRQYALSRAEAALKDDGVADDVKR